MDHRFESNEWATLSVEARIRRCRLMAAEAVAFAQTDHTSMRQRYLELAKQWTDLADDMERSLGQR